MTSISNATANNPNTNYSSYQHSPSSAIPSSYWPTIHSNNSTLYSSSYLSKENTPLSKEAEAILQMDTAKTCQWLSAAGFQDCADAFEKHQINGACLRQLTHPLLAEMGIIKVGVQKRILTLIQTSLFSLPSGVPASVVPAGDRLRLELRSSSNLSSGSGVTLKEHGKYNSLDRAAKRSGGTGGSSNPIAGASASPNIAPRSSSKNVGPTTSSERAYSSIRNNAENYLDTPTSDSPTNPQPKVPLPAAGVASDILAKANTLDGHTKLRAAGSQTFGGNSPLTFKSSQFRTLQPAHSFPSLGNGDSSLQADRVIIRVQGTNQESHKVDVTAINTDAAAIRKQIFKKFKVLEEDQKEYGLIMPTTGSKISDEELLKACSQKHPVSEYACEMHLRKTFIYGKKSLEGPLNGSFASELSLQTNVTSNGSLTKGADSGSLSGPANSGYLGNTIPVQVLQQEQKKNQTAANSLALTKNLQVFGFLGESAHSPPPTASAGASMLTSGFFDPPPRPQKSLLSKISGVSLGLTQKHPAPQPSLSPQSTAHRALPSIPSQSFPGYQGSSLQIQSDIRAANPVSRSREGDGTGASANAGASSGGRETAVSVSSNRNSKRASMKGGSRKSSNGLSSHRVSRATFREGIDDGNGRRGSKIKSFFAERPRDERILDRLGKYFPGLENDESTDGVGTTSANAAGHGAPLLTPGVSTPTQAPFSPSSSTLPPGSVRPRSDSKALQRTASQVEKSAKQQYAAAIATSAQAQNNAVKVAIPERSRSIKNKVEEAVRQNKRKSVMSTIAVRRRLSMAASAILEEIAEGYEEDGGTPRSSIQKRRGIQTVVKIGIAGKSGSDSVASSARNTAAAELDSPNTPDASPNISPMDDDSTAGDKTIVGEAKTMEDPAPLKRESLPPIVNWTQGKLIGQGAFGKVFHALNLDTGEFMAVKQVLLAAPGGKAMSAANENNKKKQTEALERELEVLKELDHENIVRYLGFEIKEGSLNLFLQYVSGGSIASLLSKTGKLELIVARDFTFQILCGMAYLHSKNIIHRDVKGANILVDADGICKISDFGTSKKNAYQMAYQRVTRMSMQGTIPWMAPEVAKGKGYSAKVDIWSVGCMVLEMMTGLPPWHKVNASIIYLLGTGNSPPIAEDLPQIAKDFLKRCFIIDPEERPTALELVDDGFCRLSPEERDSFDFRAWVLAAEEKRAQALGDLVEEDSDSDYSDSDDDSDSDSDSESESESERERRSASDEERNDAAEAMDADSNDGSHLDETGSHRHDGESEIGSEIEEVEL